MIGVISTNQTELNDIAARIHSALNSAPVRYFANEYTELINKPNTDLYAVEILEKPDYYAVIMDTLTEQEKALIGEMAPDWF